MKTKKLLAVIITLALLAGLFVMTTTTPSNAANENLAIPSGFVLDKMLTNFDTVGAKIDKYNTTGTGGSIVAKKSPSGVSEGLAFQSPGAQPSSWATFVEAYVTPNSWLNAGNPEAGHLSGTALRFWAQATNGTANFYNWMALGLYDASGNLIAYAIGKGAYAPQNVNSVPNSGPNYGFNPTNAAAGVWCQFDFTTDFCSYEYTGGNEITAITDLVATNKLKDVAQIGFWQWDTANPIYIESIHTIKADVPETTAATTTTVAPPVTTTTVPPGGTDYIAWSASMLNWTVAIVQNPTQAGLGLRFGRPTGAPGIATANRNITRAETVAASEQYLKTATGFQFDFINSAATNVTITLTSTSGTSAATLNIAAASTTAAQRKILFSSFSNQTVLNEALNDATKITHWNISFATTANVSGAVAAVFEVSNIKLDIGVPPPTTTVINTTLPPTTLPPTTLPPKDDIIINVPASGLSRTYDGNRVLRTTGINTTVDGDDGIIFPFNNVPAPNGDKWNWVNGNLFFNIDGEYSGSKTITFTIPAGMVLKGVRMGTWDNYSNLSYPTMTGPATVKFSCGSNSPVSVSLPQGTATNTLHTIPNWTDASSNVITVEISGNIWNYWAISFTQFIYGAPGDVTPTTTVSNTTTVIDTTTVSGTDDSETTTVSGTNDSNTTTESGTAVNTTIPTTGGTNIVVTTVINQTTAKPANPLEAVKNAFNAIKTADGKLPSKVDVANAKNVEAFLNAFDILSDADKAAFLSDTGLTAAEVKALDDLYSAYLKENNLTTTKATTTGTPEDDTTTKKGEAPYETGINTSIAIALLAIAAGAVLVVTKKKN